MTRADEAKARHKASAAATDEKGMYEDTAFGRRRVSRMPKWLAPLFGLVGKPMWSIYRSRRSKSG